MNGRVGHMQRLLAVLALATESGQADVEAFIDDIELQDLVVLIANLADLALRGISQPDADPKRRAALCAWLRTELTWQIAADGA
ncbi:hypothetical protein [Streptomyces sp. E5N298]|uniref:hypothetical protein n=1 Tax=Streptomyces sp. E5N298 TaxID=1851983 RepID=UPI000EF583C6|nr:hypothetical protein [Streptomyces sp. E5N298]